MAQAEFGSQTGDLPSQSVPETYGAHNPDSVLRSKIDSQPLSSSPNRVTGWRRIVAGATTFAAVATGSGAIMAPHPADAATPFLYEPSAGDTMKDTASIYCTPEYIAQYPQLLAGGDSNVGGEPVTQSAPIAEVATQSDSTTAAIEQPTIEQKVIINFTNQDGTELSILLPVCPPETEEGFPTGPDQARQMFMSKKLIISEEQSFFENDTKKYLDLGVVGIKDPIRFNILTIGTVLEVEKRGKNYLVLFGGYDKHNKPFTYVQSLTGNFDGTMAYDSFEGNIFDLSKVEFGRNPVKITEVAKSLEARRGEVFAIEGFTKPINIGYAPLDKGIPSIMHANDELFDCLLAFRKGKKPTKPPLGINIPLSRIKNDQIQNLPSVWGIIRQGNPTDLAN